MLLFANLIFKLTSCTENRQKGVLLISEFNNSEDIEALLFNICLNRIFKKNLIDNLTEILKSNIHNKQSDNSTKDFKCLILKMLDSILKNSKKYYQNYNLFEEEMIKNLDEFNFNCNICARYEEKNFKNIVKKLMHKSDICKLYSGLLSYLKDLGDNKNYYESMKSNNMILDNFALFLLKIFLQNFKKFADENSVNILTKLLVTEIHGFDNHEFDAKNIKLLTFNTKKIINSEKSSIKLREIFHNDFFDKNNFSELTIVFIYKNNTDKTNFDKDLNISDFYLKNHVTCLLGYKIEEIAKFLNIKRINKIHKNDVQDDIYPIRYLECYEII